MLVSDLDPRRWFSLPGLLLGIFTGLLLILLSPVWMPGMVSDTRNARAAEGEQMLGSLKGQTRVSYAKTDGLRPRNLTGRLGMGGCAVHISEMQGKYYRVLDVVALHGKDKAMLFAIPARTGQFEPVITLRYQWAQGDGEFKHSDGGE